jgi:hypothetical protein
MSGYFADYYDGAHVKVAEFIERLLVEAPLDHTMDQPHFNPHVDYDLRKRFKVHLNKVARAMLAIELNDGSGGDSREMESIVQCLHGTGDFDADVLRSKLEHQEIVMALATTQLETQQRLIEEKKADLVLAHMQVERMERQILELQSKEA